MPLIAPVYDRTEQDVAYAKYLRDKIFQSGYDSFTPEEKSVWDSGLRGCRNVSDLNRIENNCQYLGDLLHLELDTKTDWDYSTTPLQEDIQRICDNVSAIKNKILLTVQVDFPATPELPINNIYKLNTLELILFMANNALDYMYLNFGELSDLNETWAEIDAKQLYWQEGYLEIN